MKKIIRHHQKRLSYILTLSKKVVKLKENIRNSINKMLLNHEKVKYSDKPILEIKVKIIKTKQVWFTRLRGKGKWRRVN